MKESWRQGRGSRARVLRAALAIAVAVLLTLGALYWLGQMLERGGRKEEPRGDLTARFTQVPTVVLRGEAYRPRDQLTTVLIIGVDRAPKEPTEQTAYRNGGQSDYLMLLVIDDGNQTVTPLQIDRDTIAEVTTLGVLGNVTGTRSTQICLAHGFGDGGKQSCELTRDAVGRLLLGIDIQYYLAVDLGGIVALNDALGGVTVTLQDDFSVLDPAMVKGATLTLRGAQAEYFVRSRVNIGVGTNAARMVRQQQYWEGMSQTFSRRLAQDGGADFTARLLDVMEPWLTTNMKRGRMINAVWNSRGYRRLATVHPTGEYAVGQDGFIEFHADAAALESLVIQTFYQKAVR